MDQKVGHPHSFAPFIFHPLPPVSYEQLPISYELFSMSNIVISVKNLSKVYYLGQIGTSTLTNDLKGWWSSSGQSSSTGWKPPSWIRYDLTERMINMENCSIGSVLKVE
jgi:hypothetical protein